MDGHEFDSVLRRRAEDFVGVCRCGWSTPPMPSMSMAQAALAFHVREASLRDEVPTATGTHH